MLTTLTRRQLCGGAIAASMATFASALPVLPARASIERPTIAALQRRWRASERRWFAFVHDDRFRAEALCARNDAVVVFKQMMQLPAACGQDVVTKGHVLRQSMHFMHDGNCSRDEVDCWWEEIEREGAKFGIPIVRNVWSLYLKGL